MKTEELLSQLLTEIQFMNRVFVSIDRNLSIMVEKEESKITFPDEWQNQE